VVEGLKVWGKVWAAGALLGAAISTALSLPVPTSYFSPMVGGLKGAAKLGMEPTYYWDGLTDEALDWLNRNTPEGHTVMFGSTPTSFLYLHQVGRLKPGLYRIEPGPLAWYVVQNRPGSLSEIDRDVLAHAQERHVLSEKNGVPLVWVFPAAELERRVKLPPGAAP
jgi:hypothetical protein